jgi:hypothetical protein
MQRHRRAIELCFDFVLHLAGRDEHATKVARDATSFATPEANRASPAKCRDGEALCAGRLVWTRAIGGSGPVHSYTLQPRDCSWPLTSPRLCAVPTMRASTATLVASPRLRSPASRPPALLGISSVSLRSWKCNQTQSRTMSRKAWIFFACLDAFRYFSGRSSAEHKKVRGACRTQGRRREGGPESDRLLGSGFSNVARKRSHRDCGFWRFSVGPELAVLNGWCVRLRAWHSRETFLSPKHFSAPRRLGRGAVQFWSR